MNKTLYRESKAWFQGVLLVLIFLLLASITIAVMLGPVPISPITVWKIAVSQLPGMNGLVEMDWSKAQQHIIWDVRFPRVLLGAITGMGLALVGAAIQALMRNPLADPYILGVSSGASVGATSAIIFGAFSLFGPYAISAGAFIGALCAILLVYVLAQVGGRIASSRLLLSGVVVSMILSAVTSFIVTMAPREQGIRDAYYWMMGSLTGAKWEYVAIPGTGVVFGLIYLLFQHRSLNALTMGEETAVTLGVDVQRFRKTLILLLSLLIGIMVSVSGSIGFVGLIVPHISRFMVGADHRRLLPVTACLGAIMMIWGDVAARLVLAPEELPIGVVTALCGGPFFIWQLRRSNRGAEGRKR